jgi:DtxR family transcriptional regulator, Mn-dependent transcriptional regulator
VVLLDKKYILGYPKPDFMRDKLTTQAEDYLKAMYGLEHGLEHNPAADNKVNTQALATRLGVTPASATGMLKKLSELGLVEHTLYRGANLTAAGTQIALELLRHHRLLELYLHQALGYALEDVHDEAEKLEHVISEVFEAKINALLGDPTHDPHGAPIPRLDGSIPTFATKALADVKTGTTVRIGRIHESDNAFLRFVSQLGLIPGALLKVTEVNVTAGTITLQFADVSHVLGLHQAQLLFVDDYFLGN